MTIITLAPKGSFHIGEPIGIERQGSLAYIPSDTLFAALVTAWAQTGELARWLPQLSESPPPLLLTTAFPCLYTGDGEHPQATLRFFPRPMVRINASQDSKNAAGKDLKKTAWVSERLFAQLARGDAIDRALLDTRCFGPGGIWVTPEDLPRDAAPKRQSAKDEKPTLCMDAEDRISPLWKQWDTPRVTVDRVSGASHLYHIGRVTTAEHVGFWFALRGDAALVAAVQRALALLADSGLGGLRSTGHGAFTWDATQDELPTHGQSAYAVTLSRYAPRDAAEVKQALQCPQTAYSLVNVGGWCVDDAQHAWRRKSVRLISEGGVIGNSACGRLVDVTPERPRDWQEAATPWPFNARKVYRYGYAFTIGIAASALPEEVTHA